MVQDLRVGMCVLLTQGFSSENLLQVMQSLVNMQSMQIQNILRQKCRVNTFKYLHRCSMIRLLHLLPV